MGHHDQRQAAPGDRAARRDGLLEKAERLRRGGSIARIPDAGFDGRAVRVGHHDVVKATADAGVAAMPDRNDHRPERTHGNVHESLPLC